MVPPLPVQNRVPSGVPTTPLVDQGLTKEPFMLKPEPLRCGTRRGVERVALPFDATVSQTEALPECQEDSFRGDAGPIGWPHSLM